MQLPVQAERESESDAGDERDDVAAPEDVEADESRDDPGDGVADDDVVAHHRYEVKSIQDSYFLNVF